MNHRKQNTYVASCTQKRNQRTLYDILVDTNTPNFHIRSSSGTFNIASSFDVSAATDSMLFVIRNIKINPN